jgi:hypothetical protein
LPEFCFVDNRGDETSRGECVTLSFWVVTGIIVDFLTNLFGWRGVFDEVVEVADFLSSWLNCIELSSSNGLFVDARWWRRLGLGACRLDSNSEGSLIASRFWA